jgi:hypothetical protein
MDKSVHAFLKDSGKSSLITGLVLVAVGIAIELSRKYV